jgi:anaerobic magnesium-protoporphyrin IX monomethyl ester cyclase
MEEIRRLHDEFGVNHITFWDELTFHNIDSVKSMVSKIASLPFKIGWDAEARGNLFKKKDLGLIKEMKESGCDNVFFALENGSPEILAAINKRISVDDFIEQALVMADGGITPFTGVIFGYPQETRESIKLTFDICEKSNIFPSIGFLLLLPGTHMYEWAKENGYIKDELDYLMRAGDRQDLHINLTKIPDAELIALVDAEGRKLAKKQGLELESVFKTTAYHAPKKVTTTNG